MKFTVVIFAFLVAGNAAEFTEDAKKALQTVTNKAKDIMKIIKTTIDEAINTVQTTVNGGFKTADESVRGGFKTLEELLAKAQEMNISTAECLKDKVTITERNLTFFRNMQDCVDNATSNSKEILNEGYDEINEILDTFTKFSAESTCSNWFSCAALTAELAVKEGLAITQIGGKVPVIATKTAAVVINCMTSVTREVGGFVKDVMNILSVMISCITDMF